MRTFSRVDLLMKCFLLNQPDESTGSTLDFETLRRVYSHLFSVPEEAYLTALSTAIDVLSTSLSIGAVSYLCLWCHLLKLVY